MAVVRDMYQFTEHLFESSKDPLFIEFLQQLFPWVISNPYGPSPGQRFSGIGWAINEISEFLYAAENYCEGSVRLVRSSPDRPRGSFGYLLHGQNTTVRLRAKLHNLILDVFYFARPDTIITQLEWRQLNTSHTNGVFNACLVLWHTDSATQPAATGLAGERGLAETLVHLRLDSPDNQGHLPGIDRDVDIFIKVERGDDVPDLIYSSQDSISKSESMASLVSSDDERCSDASGNPLVRLNATSLPAKIAAASDRASSADSDSTLRYDSSQDEDGVSINDKTARVNASESAATAAAEIAIECLRGEFGAGSIGAGGEVGSSATSSKAIELPWARISPKTERLCEKLYSKLHATQKGQSCCINVSTDGQTLKNTLSLGTTLQETKWFPSLDSDDPCSTSTLCNCHRVHFSLASQELAQVVLFLSFFCIILFPDYNIQAGHATKH
jgi:hypothetical protein